MVSVIIVTIGKKAYLKNCLDSLLKQIHLPAEIIVIDNSLKPALGQEIKQIYPFVKICSGVSNLFYAVALNKGISMSNNEFILCLNDDVVLDKEFIQQGLKVFSMNSKIGAVSGKILRSDGEIIDSSGLFLSIWRTAKERGYGQPDRGQFDKAGFVFGVNGAVAFYRKKMLTALEDKYGYFDSRFKMFYEDLDLAWRAKKKGWLTYYFPAAIAYHVRGGSLRPDAGINQPLARKYLDNQLHCCLIRNRYLTILKNETFLGVIAHFFPILIYDLCVWSYCLIFSPRVVRLFFSKLK